jgi:hypothetical protein
MGASDRAVQAIDCLRRWTNDSPEFWGWAKTDFLEEPPPKSYEPDKRTDEETQKLGLWAACYDDSCMLHWGAKNATLRVMSWPPKESRTGAASGRDAGQI